MTQLGTVVITEDSEHAGACVWWELAGEAPALALREALVDLGVSETLWPRAITAESAFRRAMLVFQNASTLVRPMAHGAYAVLPRERDSSDRPRFVTAWTARLNEASDLEFTDADPTTCDDVWWEYSQALQSYGHQDLSAWLAQCAAHCSAVRLRSSGGFYFVPRPGLQLWRACVSALEAVSESRSFTIPALATRDAVAAVLHALREEAGEVLGAIDEELTGGTLQARALKSRADKCRALEAKLTEYASLLGNALPDVQTKLESMGARIGAAELALSTAGGVSL